MAPSGWEESTRVVGIVSLMEPDFDAFAAAVGLRQSLKTHSVCE